MNLALALWSGKANSYHEFVSVSEQNAAYITNLAARLWFGFPTGTMVKNRLRHMGSVLVLGRSPGEENSYPLPYSCLGNPMNRGAWPATIYGVAKSWTLLSD